jgi:hypothetical protein
MLECTLIQAFCRMLLPDNALDTTKPAERQAHLRGGARRQGKRPHKLELFLLSQDGGVLPHGRNVGSKGSSDGARTVCQGLLRIGSAERDALGVFGVNDAKGLSRGLVMPRMSMPGNGALFVISALPAVLLPGGKLCTDNCLTVKHCDRCLLK